MRNTRIYLGEWSEARVPHGCTVLTPNENAASTLGVTPLSLEALAQQVLGEGRVAHPVLMQRILRRAVEEVMKSTDADGVAHTLLPSIRELFRAGADIGINLMSSRARRIVEVARTYRERLREQGFVDPAEALWEAARSSPPRRAVMVWGYPRLGPAEVAFVDAVAGEGSVVYLPYAEDPLFGENLEAAQALRQREWTVEQAPLPRAWEVNVSLQANSYAHLEAEVRGALAQVKALLVDGVPPRDVVLVTREDAAYGPTVLEVAREYGVPVQALYQVPISDTRVGFWLRLLFEAMTEGFPFETTARVLAHPLGPGISHTQWAKAREVRARGVAAWEEIGVDLPPMWPEEDTRARWIEWFNALLEAHALTRKVTSWPREVMALANLKGAMEWLREPLEETISRERFLREVDEILHTAATPTHPDREGVALHTPLSLYGARYRFVFVLGLVEGIFPPPADDDPALDFHERKRLRERGIRLELADERARRERLSFWTLLRVPQERLVFSYPKLVAGRAVLPSPYFQLVGAEPVPPGLLPAASLEEARRAFLQRGGLENDPVLPRAVRNWEVERRREGPAPFDAHDGVLGIPLDYEERHFSVSELRDLGHCGFRWWSGYVLKLTEPEEGESPALTGRLYHKVLEIATRRSLGAPDLRQGVLNHLEEAFEDAERELEMTQLVRGWEAWRTLYLAQLQRAVMSDDFALPGAEVLETEISFSAEWRGFQVEGRVDRVDRTPEGLVFVDYKSTASTPKPDLQLSIYREAAAPALFPGEPVKDAYYYSLTKGERISAKQPSADELARMAEEVKANLEAGYLPPDVFQRVCDRCEFDLVSRRGPRLDRKGRES